MKRIFTGFLVMALLVCVLSASMLSYVHAVQPEETATPIVPKSSTPITTYTSLGAPAASYYASNRYVARCAWDMAICDGRLFVGCGDFSKNTGDTPILSCPLDDLGEWSVECTIPEEQVGRFVDINGVLTIPGFDPVMGGPENAAYYERINGQWHYQDKLPYGLHNFDVVWFHGRMYAGVGADRGESPIAYTEDGEVFDTLPLYKNGKEFSTDNSDVIRVSNLYVLGDSLYADFWYEDEDLSRSVFEMYRFNEEEDRFEFVSDLKKSTHGGLYSSAHLPLWSKVAYGDNMFLTTGYLFYTADFVTYTELELPNAAVTYDMTTFDGRLYLLAAHKSGDEYTVTVYSTDSTDPDDLQVEATYTYAVAPTSFAVNADNFFIGMGDWHDSGNAVNGTILQLKR